MEANRNLQGTSPTEADSDHYWQKRQIPKTCTDGQLDGLHNMWLKSMGVSGGLSSQRKIKK